MEVVAADAGFVSSAAADIRRQATAALEEGMEGLNQAKVGSAMQVREKPSEAP